MIIRTTFIFLIILVFSFIVAQENENTLIVNGEKLYFSIGGHINLRYYKKNLRNYSSILKSYYIKRTQEIGHQDNRFGPTEVDLPDSLSKSYFDIKKGFYSIKVDSIKSNPFTIDGFKTTTSIEGSGKSRVIISTPESIDKNWQDLLLISKDFNTLNHILPYNLKEIQDYEINTKIKKNITNYFLQNPELLKKQATYQYPVADSLNKKQLKNLVSSMFDLMNFEINDNCYFVKGLSPNHGNHTFFAIVFLNENKIIMKITSKLNQVFIINNDYYFFCKDYLPYTGGNTYYVYKLKVGKLESVFIDGSYSM